MISKFVSDLRGNEILAKPVITMDYQVLLPEGSVLKEEFIDKLLSQGIFEVYIEENRDEEVEILRSDVKDSVTSKVKHILERHTYQYNNEELISLQETVEEIITVIMEEEKVVEQLYEIKNRNADLYEHSIGVCSLAALCALRMGCRASMQHDIGVGSLLHDIGHRYSKNSFINKKIEDFSQEEMAEYKKHPVYGYSSVKDQDWISSSARNIILYHHERIDGHGFPLRTTEIPLPGRIVSVCDAFDEMMSGICCEKKTVSEAAKVLRDGVGSAYDEKAVDTLLSFVAFYPIGTMVETNEGEIAKVISQNVDKPDRPIIQVVSDERVIDLLECSDIVIKEIK